MKLKRKYILLIAVVVVSEELIAQTDSATRTCFGISNSAYLSLYPTSYYINVFYKNKEHKIFGGADIHRFGSGIIGVHGGYQYYLRDNRKFNYYLQYNVMYVPYISGTAMHKNINYKKVDEYDDTAIFKNRILSNIIGFGIEVRLVKPIYFVSAAGYGISWNRRTIIDDELIENIYMQDFYFQLGLEVRLKQWD